MGSMQQQLGVLGTISAFAFRHRETKKNLCRGGRLQDLPDTDFQPAIRQLKYVRQQYTHSKTIHMRKQKYTQDNNTIHKRPNTISSNTHRKSNTIAVSGIPNRLSLCAVLIIYTHFTDVVVGRIMRSLAGRGQDTREINLCIRQHEMLLCFIGLRNKQQ